MKRDLRTAFVQSAGGRRQKSLTMVIEPILSSFNLSDAIDSSLNRSHAMLNKQTLFARAGLAFVMVYSGASAATQSRGSAEYQKVEQLIRLIDKDKNGVVTKDEFLQFASSEFDRVDADKSGSLSQREFARSHLAHGRHFAEHENVAALIRMMDADKNGEVSKAEFMSFMSAEFDRIDADKSGTLTHEELSNSIFVHPQQKAPGGTHK
jgi:Ca2+-binding EF-hand superfamily protein